MPKKKKQAYAVLSFDIDNSRTGGTRLTREAALSLQQHTAVCLKEWKRDFSIYSQKSKIIASLEIMIWIAKVRPEKFLFDSRMFSLVWIAVILCRLLKIRLVTILQESHSKTGGQSWNGVSGFIRNYLLRFVCRSADSLVTNSSVTARYAKDEMNINTIKIRTVAPGFDPCKNAKVEKRKKEKNCLSILCVGRYTWRKGIDVLSQSLELYNYPYQAIVVGDDIHNDNPAYEKKLKQYADTLNIEFKGRVDSEQLGNLYNWADVIIVPSRVEAFGIVVLESLWYGVPIIASDALPEEIRTIHPLVFSFKNEDYGHLTQQIKMHHEMFLKRRQVERKPLIDEKEWAWERFGREFWNAINDLK